MSRMFRNACIAVAGLVMLLMGTSSALATQSINPTTVSATSSNSQLLILTQGSLTTTVCTSFRLGTVTVASTGAVTIPAGTVTFAGCRLNGNTANITQAAAWSGQITALLSGSSITGALLRITIPSNGIRVAATGCSTLALGGSASALTTVTARTPPALVSVTSLTFTNAGLDTLAVVATTGCAIVPVGSTGGFTGTFPFSGPVTGTLI